MKANTSLRYLMSILCAALVVLALSGTSAQADALSAGEARTFSAALKEVQRSNKKRLNHYSRQLRDPLARKVVSWYVLFQGGFGTDFDAINAFIQQNPEWPRSQRLLGRAEEALKNNLEPNFVIDWFAGREPVTTLGREKLADALIRNGIPVRHIETGKNVPMYRSNIDLVPAGRFSGKMVVTMRPIPEDLVEQARRISRQYPQAHGAPIATGDPAEIGIADLSQPDWGDAVEIQPDEVPVYWACGVTPQNVLLDAKLPICITHSPGHMLVTDVSEDAETTILPNPQNS